MPIGDSDGNFHEDQLAYQIAKEGSISIKPVESTPSTDSTMPVGSPTEPAGALKPSGGTEVPGNVPETNFPTPYGLNPPEGNAIQSYIKGIEDNLNSLPETFRNIPEEFSKNMEKSKSKTDDERLDEAINVGLSAGPGTMAGVKSISSLTGVAKSEALSNLGHAQVLESNGVHPDDIWKQTGFGRGADSRWRYELDDSKSVLDQDWSGQKGIEDIFKKQGIALDTRYGPGGKNNTYGLRKWKTDEKINPADLPTELKSTWLDLTSGKGTIQKNLSDILDHPELYKAYPWAKNIQVKYDPEYTGVAEWNNSNTITMGKRAIESDNQHGILMHEVQHAIQDHEGFARGGAPGTPGVDFNLKYAKAANDVVNKALGLLDKLNQGLTTPAEDAYLAYAKEVAQKYQEYHKAGAAKAEEYYMRLAGETEARNTDTRLLLNAKERRQILPRSTETVNPRDQIIVNKPVSTTAYGVRDPKTGKLIK